MKGGINVWQEFSFDKQKSSTITKVISEAIYSQTFTWTWFLHNLVPGSYILVISSEKQANKIPTRRPWNINGVVLLGRIFD